MAKKVFLFVTFLYVFFACSNLVVFAQKYNFRNYTTQDGLANNLVIDLLQDKSGKIWIGTGDGVSCYDGAKFKNYRSSARKPTNASRVDESRQCKELSSLAKYQ
ncbi:MAG: two-component regulator propeller domain-containing protein [Blastocatellia bacterium]